MKKIFFLISLILISLTATGALVFSAQAETESANATIQMVVPSDICPGCGSNTDNPPVISNVSFTVAATTAQINWTATDSDATGVAASTLEYGLTQAYGQSGVVGGSYSSSLTGLTPDTVYYFRITARDTANYSSTYAGSFRTSLSGVPLVLSNISAEANITTATIRWNSNRPANSQVNYGLDITYGNTFSDVINTANHLIGLVQLLPNTTYHYRVISTDIDGVGATSGDNTFTTLSDDIAPPNVTNFQLATTSAAIVLTWSNPSLAQVPDFAGVRIMRKIGSASSGINDGTVVYTGTSQAFTDNTVVRGVVYYYTIFSFDTSGNYSSGIYRSGRVTGEVVVQEICNNSTDDDGDGFIDCADNDCRAFPACVAGGGEICNNNQDDDGDGLIDCADPDCSAQPGCNGQGNEICNNSRDDDGDGFIDCADNDCRAFPACVASGGEICNNGQDDDGDGLIDCADLDCSNQPGCGGSGSEICNNGRDDDNDSFIDCSDNDCRAFPACVAGGGEICNNNSDDDGDGLVDCADPDCSALPGCGGPGLPEICGNGIDDDLNGKIDCLDDACKNLPACGQPGGTEICDNGLDDDEDGRTDCADSDCAGFLGCKGGGDDDDYNPPTSTVPDPLRLSLSKLMFLAGNRQITLVPSGNIVTSLAGSNFTIGVRRNDLYGPPLRVELVVGGLDRHQLVYSPATQHYFSDLSYPSLGLHRAFLEVYYLDGKFDSVSFWFKSLPFGLVQSENIVIPGAKIFLLDNNGKPFDVNRYGEFNPYYSTINGTYGWVVPNRSFIIQAEKTGFYTYRTLSFATTNNVINQNLRLTKRPPGILDDVDPDDPLGRKALKIAENLLDKGRAGLDLTVNKIDEIKQNETARDFFSNIVAPGAFGVAAIGVLALVPWLSLLALLRFLFLQPLLLIGRRKRESWGEIYNSLTKLPIDLAIIRLINVENNRVVQTKVTSKQGRYLFVAAPGKYRIDVSKNGFTYPSELLRKYKDDGRRVDIYHGEIIEVNEEEAVITANIPLDPIGENKPPRRLFWYRVGRFAQTSLSWVGLIITAVSFYFSPRWYVGLILLAHIALFFIFRRLSNPAKIKSWGIVYDAETKNPLARTVARLFSAQFNKLVASQITDHKGRYYFLAGDNKYYVTYERQKYKTKKTDVIDLTGKQESSIIMDIPMEKEGKNE